MNKIIDDSKEKIEYYTNQLKNHKDQSKLQKIIEIMDIWSEIVKRKSISESQKNILTMHLKDSFESIWFEAGQYLAQFSSIDKSINNIFLSCSLDSNWSVRFNIAALIPKIGFKTQKALVVKLLDDKSRKVKIKTIDSILRTSDNRFKKLLEKKMKHESNKDVIENINFVLDNWGRN